MAHEVQITISMNTDKEEFLSSAKDNPVAAAKSLAPELRRFDNWMMSKGMDPLTRIESQILKEYLGSKLTA